MNTSLDQSGIQISKLFSLIGEPRRVLILFSISQQETCVCHLVASLGMRQSVVSQHLMVLRKAGLVSTSREGRHIYYRLVKPEVITLLEDVVACLDISPQVLRQLATSQVPGCTCPRCIPDLRSERVCQKVPGQIGFTN